jgi:type VI protein secretion system component VasK
VNLAAGAAGGAIDTLVQYGALGVLVVVLLGVVRVLYADKARQHEYERARADRLEQLVLTQSQAMVDKIIPVLTAATQTMSEMLDRMERSSEDRDRRPDLRKRP